MISKPTSPELYNKPQIILNSGRLLFNAKDDILFLIGKQAVSISTPGTINLDADSDIILNSEKEIHLGILDSKNANKKEESALLGDTTISSLSDVFKALAGLSEALSTIYDEKGGGVFYPTNAAAFYLKKTLENWDKIKDKNKSKKVKLV
jgi:hypothetical protein